MPTARNEAPLYPVPNALQNRVNQTMYEEEQYPNRPVNKNLEQERTKRD